MGPEEEEEEDPKTLPWPLIAKMVAGGCWAVGNEEQSLEGDPKCRYKDLVIFLFLDHS